MYRGGGKRPEGSDGSDHWHRESIAWHYKVLADNKPRLKTNLMLHIMLTMLMLVRLLPIIIDHCGFTPLAIMQMWNFPAERWMWVWLTSVIFVPLGWRSMTNTSIKLITLYIIGILLSGSSPVFYAIYNFYHNYELHFAENKINALMTCAFLSVASQIHVFGTYIAIILIKAYYKVQQSKKKDWKAK